MQLSRQQIAVPIAILILIFASIRFGAELAAEQSNNKKRSHIKAVDIGESVEFRNVLEKNWELFFDSPVSPPAWGDGPFVSDLI